MKRILAYTILTLFRLCWVPAMGQYTPSDIDLNAAGLNPTLHAKMRVRDMPDVAGDTTKARLKFPAAFGYLKAAKGWVWGDGRFMLLSVASAYGLQAVWSGHALAYTQPCISRNHIKAEGEYWVNYPVPKHMGFWEGAGPHLGWYAGHAALTFHVWKDAWLGDDVHEMCSMLSTGYKLDGGAGWLHGGRLEGIGFVGNNSGWYDPSYTESGLVLWDEAEASSIGNLWSDSHNGYGIKIIRGTPTHFTGTISVFTNALGGIGLFDGELGTVRLGVVSGDDNPALIVFDSKYGRGAGGMVSFALDKSESGKRFPNKAQLVIWQRSPCVGAVSVDMCQADMNDMFLDAPFVMNSRAWGQTLTVTGFVGWNMRTIVHDVTNQKRWAGGSYSPQVFVWASRNGGTFADLVTLTMVPGTPVNATDRLGMVPNNGVFDYVNGLPKYVMGAAPPPPPPTPCTGWVTGAWGPCDQVTKQQTRVVTESPAGCTGTPPGTKPPNTQTCTVPPPPVGTSLSRAGWVATASRSDASQQPSRGIDTNPGTLWQSGADQAAGMWYAVNLGSTQTFSQAVIVSGIAGPPLTDSPKGYTFQVNSTATCASSGWTTVATGAGSTSNATTTISFAERTARCVRLNYTANHPNHWGSVGDFDLRR